MIYSASAPMRPSSLDRTKTNRRLYSENNMNQKSEHKISKNSTVTLQSDICGDQQGLDGYLTLVALLDYCSYLTLGVAFFN